MRGRKRTPTVLKVLTGNPGRRPINLDEPQPDQLEAATPDELRDPVARAEWVRAIRPAIRIGQVTAADRTLAIMHCELWSQWRSQLAAAARGAHVIKTGKHKYPMPNPARVMANKTLLLLARIDETLGFSPTSRARVQVKGPGSVGSTLDKQRAKFFASSRG